MYSVDMQSIQDRKAHISAKQPDGRTESIRFRGVQTLLEVKKVQNKYLKYRLENMRTSVKQSEVITEKGLAGDFFDAAGENPSAQQEQHEILVELSKVATADIYSELRDNPNQDRPVLITDDGLVVDGNRRLAAMRDLYATDPVRYANFDWIDVAELDGNTTDDELVELETIIQIKPDLKAEYGWVEECIGLQKQIDNFSFSYEKLTSLWGESKEELQSRLQMLSIAKEFLTHINKAGQYSEVADSEQAIKTFVGEMNGDRYQGLDPERKEAEKLVFFDILGSTEISLRKYEYAREIEKVTDGVLRHINLESVPDVTGTTGWTNPFSGLPNSGENIRAAVDLLRDGNTAEEIAGYAEESLIEHKAQKKAEKRGNQLLQAASSANSKLASVEFHGLQPATYSESVKELLRVIYVSCNHITTLLNEDANLANNVDVAEINQLKAAQNLLSKFNKN
jgi:hypothetical protein